MFERLTLRPDIGLDEIWFANSDDPEGAYTIHSIAECGRDDVLDAIAERLAAYEDTGLTPEEVVSMKDHYETDMESYANENAQLQHALATMWFAYVNKDGECPHQFEDEAIALADKLLGGWEGMAKHLREERADDER